MNATRIQKHEMEIHSRPMQTFRPSLRLQQNTHAGSLKQIAVHWAAITGSNIFEDKMDTYYSRN